MNGCDEQTLHELMQN